MKKWCWTLLLLAAGCSGLFLSPEERAQREAAKGLVSNVGVFGASVSAGFGTGRSLAEILDSALRLPHAIVEDTDIFFFAKAHERAREAVAKLNAAQVTLSFALDGLFWFAYGDKPLENRREDLSRGLRILEELQGVLVVGDLPDMSGAAEEMLPAAKIPPPGELAELNHQIEEWARGRPRARVLPLSRWMRAIRAGDPIEVSGQPVRFLPHDLLEDDGLHPTDLGQALLVVLSLEALARGTPGFTADDFAKDPRELIEHIDALPCAVSVEIVDDGGQRVKEATLEFHMNAMNLLGKLLEGDSSMLRYRHLEDPTPILGRNPFELKDLPARTFAGKLGVRARASRLVPSELTEFVLIPGKVVQVRVRVGRPYSQEIEVRDSATGAPIASAGAVSVTECKARSGDASVSLMEGGPGAGSSNADGRLVLHDLRRGSHRLEILAGGHVPLALEGVHPEKGEVLEARLERAVNASSVRAYVFGPSARPAAGVGVELKATGFESGRVVITDETGQALFEGVAPGEYGLKVDFSSLLQTASVSSEDVDEPRAHAFERTIEVGPSLTAQVDLGWLRGPHEIEVRVTDERGSPKESVEISLTGPLDLGEERFAEELMGACIYLAGSSDEAGRIVFSGLEDGKYHLDVDDLDGTHEAVDPVPPVQFPSAGVRTSREIRVRPRRAGSDQEERRN